MHIIHTAPGFAFVPKGRELDTLFQPIDGRTAAGTYQRTAGGVTFYALAGEPFAFLVVRPVESWFVSCGLNTAGRVFYMHGMADMDAERLGIAAQGWSEQHATAARIAAELEDAA